MNQGYIAPSPAAQLRRSLRAGELSLVGDWNTYYARGGLMRNVVWSSLLLSTLSLSSLSAQDAPQRKGFWIGFGLGAGVNLAQNLDDKSLWGGNGYIRL